MGNDWLTLVDYAARKGVSLSTLRRYIKSQRIQYRIENGRYLIPENALTLDFVSAPAHAIPLRPGVSAEQAEIERLRAALQRANEEVTELKMLIAVYEDAANQPGSRG